MNANYEGEMEMRFSILVTFAGGSACFLGTVYKAQLERRELRVAMGNQ